MTDQEPIILEIKSCKDCPRFRSIERKAPNRFPVTWRLIWIAQYSLEIICHANAVNAGVITSASGRTKHQYPS